MVRKNKFYDIETNKNNEFMTTVNDPITILKLYADRRDNKFIGAQVETQRGTKSRLFGTASDNLYTFMVDNGLIRSINLLECENGDKKCKTNKLCGLRIGTTFGMPLEQILDQCCKREKWVQQYMGDPSLWYGLKINFNSDHIEHLNFMLQTVPPLPIPIVPIPDITPAPARRMVSNVNLFWMIFLLIIFIILFIGLFYGIYAIALRHRV
jgi:hypothetical protein